MLIYKEEMLLKHYDRYTIVKPSIPNGYWRVSCYKNGKRVVSAKTLHSVLADIMFGPKPKDDNIYHIHHLDGDIENNLPCNLIRITNTQHSKTIETDRRTYKEKYGDDAEYMKKHVTRNCHSKEAIEKRKKTIKEKGYTISKQTREKMKKSQKKYWQSEDGRKKRSNITKEMWKKRDTYIICNETNIIYKTQKEACEALGITRSRLCNHLNGKFKHAGGYTFQHHREKTAQEIRERKE